MANTFTQLYVQIIFSTQNRERLLKRPFRDEVFKYISGIVKNKKQTPLAVNGAIDHIHIFLGFKPNIAISDLVRDIKHFSTEFINEKEFMHVKFSWQSGYGAYTYSHSQIDTVIKYIMNQEKHHKTKTFKEEYLEFLEKFNVEYYMKYVFD